MLRLREFFRVVDVGRVAALHLDQLLELLERRAIGQMALHGLLGRKRRARDARQADDLHTELEHELLHVFRAFALEQRDRFLELQRRADGIAERLVHIGHQRHTAALHRAAHTSHRTRELLGLLKILDEGAIAPLHVDHEAFGALGQFLGKHGAGDQREARDRARLLAQRVEFGVGRGEILVLRTNRAIDLRQLRRELVVAELGLETGDRAELVERADDVVMLHAAHHRHHHTGGHRQRHQHQRRLVAHATRRVLVDLRLGDFGQVNHFAGNHHLLRQLRSFLR